MAISEMFSLIKGIVSLPEFPDDGRPAVSKGAASTRLGVTTGKLVANDLYLAFGTSSEQLLLNYHPNNSKSS